MKMAMSDKEISKYFSDLAKKRKNPYFGFKDPKIQKKALEKRLKKNIEKNV